MSPEEFRLVLSPEPRAGWRARQALRKRYTDVLPPRTMVDLLAVVTELVNNAVKHGPGQPVTVAVVSDGETVRGEIADKGNPAAAIPEIREATETGGRGLDMVEKLTSRWAVFEGSTHVWFEMPVDT
jgi:signal transduction histidine kinase